MNLFFILFFIILIVFFIPIPIKIFIYYSLDDYYINIFNFTIFSKKKHNLSVSKNVPPKTQKEIKHKKNLKNNFSNKLKLKDFKNLLSKLYNSKFKPKLNLKFDMEYSLGDAAKTAIFYGSLNAFSSPFYILLNIPFCTKKISIDINPIFEDKYLLKIKSKSIVFLSFANIIYIAIIILKSILSSKEVAPKD